MKLNINNITVDDTYCEAFSGVFTRFIITAGDKKRLKRAAYLSTALPSTVFGKSEGGIEAWLDPADTPDGRIGAVVQIWVNDIKDSDRILAFELGWRIRQGILVVPTTSVFNALESGTSIDLMAPVGYCADGYQVEEKRYGRQTIVLPLMMGEFIIERYLCTARGVMGGNVWFFCDSIDSALEAGDKAVVAVDGVKGAVSTFDICSAGSKPVYPGQAHPEVGPSTNHPYCPTLKGKIPDFAVPDGIESIPEIVINGVDEKAVGNAMKAAMYAASGVQGLKRISAGNYDRKLGKFRIYLKDLL
ncbi:MAG: formylmethanofuran--tetrahydromethanopterin N-formyltransferase [ANME-2 cluster archaeon]|nr:formylmethanofuran--tetrahydromethanopterin N-formyltransferase [ANME-2 cluster archaeon]MBC2699934.1 formylmethanofuran--tetrahydromethanopterin N-formyltransferase [ANME-2 cluster archaeon]MBC2707047.1 formylmethanofuran--tetrahydromethanopterin N-formyltransferase [ANME-2 cluster archaeon]MBC2746939.1 formylmethanofuran--tetrahydromethanopterin N-formyltransferase [ANME-2 cluster archaeon]MBC2762361.1 formylmethanofuran--tetrahydromethanopterin N-formyltransferase [ANME-2 cluster archaeon